MGKKKLHQDVYIGIGCAVLTGIVFLMNGNLPSDAAMMPRLLGALMGILSVLIFYQGLKKSKTEEAEHSLTLDAFKVPFICWIIIGLYVLLFKLGGYFVATPIMLIGLMRYMKQTSWKGIILITVGYLLIMYLFFVKQMGISIDNLGMIGKML